MPTSPEPHTVIVGDDGSAGADVAWRWALDQPWGPDWGVDVVHVVPPGPAEEPPPRRSAPPGWPVPVASHLLEGDPRTVLATGVEGDLVVVGTTGAGFAARWLHLGGTADALIAGSALPVVVAGRAATVRQVLVATDGSDTAARAVERFATLPWAKQAAVLAVGVYDGWADPEAGLHHVEVTLGAAGIEHRCLQVRGRATEELHRYIRGRSPDLVVLGRHGQRGAVDLRVGSTTSALVRTAGTSVLVVP